MTAVMERKLQTKNSPELREIYREKYVERALHQETSISIYNLNYDGSAQTSVFIHPSSFPLDEGRIIALDSHFSSPVLIAFRKFRDASIEDADAALHEAARPLISFMAHDYSLHRPRILEHSFPFKSEVYLRNVLNGLRI